MTSQILQQKFISLFGRPASRGFFCPAQVHRTRAPRDYHNGMKGFRTVTTGTYLLSSPNNTFEIRLRSLNFSEEVNVPAGSAFVSRGHHWFNYPMGVLMQLELEGRKLTCGWDLLFFDNQPASSDTSLGAAGEIVTAFAFNKLLAAGYSPSDVIRLTINDRPESSIRSLPENM